jgi:putative ABC transport system permease protein
MDYIPGIRRVFRLEGGKESVEHNVDEELQFHFDMATRDLVAQGWSAEDARREVLRRFGDVDEMRDRLRQIDYQLVQRRRLSDWWFSFWQDLRYAARGLRRRPGFCAGVILTLALGIGANSAMFGIIDRLLFRPPAYMTGPAHTHRVYLVRTFDGVENPGSNISYRRYLELSSLTRSFSKAAAFWNSKVVVGSGESAREMQTGAVSASYFDFFDARPVIGRFFTKDEDLIPDGSSVAVLGDIFWRTRYGGRADALGQTLQVAGRVYTIIGVAPPGFAGVADVEPAVFVPITSIVSAVMGGDAAKTYYSKHNMSWMEMLVRRKPSVSVAEATSDLTLAYRQSYIDQRIARPTTTPIEVTKPHAVIAPVLKERGPRRGDDTKVAVWLLGVTAIVFLIACANVANLLLTRMFSRRREIAIRLALGVSRMRLLQQLMTESIVLALLGGAAGLFVAQWIGTGLRTVLLPEAAWSTTSADSRILLFTGVCALAAGVLIGLGPALQTMGATLAPSLRSREGHVQQSRARVVLLVLQGAFSVVLLVGAGLFVRSLHNARALHLGYDPESIVFASVEKRGVHLSEAEETSLRERLLARARELPGVVNVSPVLTVPFWMTENNDVFVPGVDTSKTNHMEMDVQAGSPDFFKTTGTRILRGRGIEPGDNATSPKVTVVSERLAQALWPGKPAIGQCMKLGGDTVPCTTVVGVAENIMAGDLRKDETLMYYLPMTQTPKGSALRNNLIFVRVNGRAIEQKESVRRALQRLMPGAAFVSVVSLAEIIEPNYRPWLLGARMFAAFGLLAILLAAIGLYSVISYDAKQRTPEIGIRIALGAQPAQVVRLVMAEGGRFVLAGTVIGCAIALALSRWVQPLLFDTSARDPLVFGSVVVTLLGVAALATFIPARRATRVDPSTALRAE